MNQVTESCKGPHSFISRLRWERAGILMTVVFDSMYRLYMESGQYISDLLVIWSRVPRPRRR